jgi:cation transport ATPase
MFNVILEFLQKYFFPLFYLYLWLVSVFIWFYVAVIVAYVNKLWYFSSKSIWSSYCKRAPNKRSLKFSTIVVSMIFSLATATIVFSILRTLVFELFYLIMTLSWFILVIRGIRRARSRAFKYQVQAIK